MDKKIKFFFLISTIIIKVLDMLKNSSPSSEKTIFIFLKEKQSWKENKEYNHSNNSLLTRAMYGKTIKYDF